MIKTKNFHPARDKKLKCTCGHTDCDQRSVSQEALDNAQRMRDDLGSPLTINSGGRCPNHPNEIYKRVPGDHQACMAIDFACDNTMMETKIKVLAGRYDATRVAGGAYCGFVHVAWTDTDRTDVPTWAYNQKD